ncbi:MAG: hypothetical protein ACT4OO_02030 [Nitrospiraceae bacterium]
MKKLLQILGGMALVFVAALLAELPPMPAAVAWIQAREWTLILATGSLGVIGFTLMMGGILKLLMDRDESLNHADVEDVERSVRMAARPVTWRASSYRLWGRGGGQQGSEQFTFGELKQAWKSGMVWRDSVWKRRLITTVGALMMAAGLLGTFVVLGPGWVKVLLGGMLLYTMGMITWGLWKA